MGSWSIEQLGPLQALQHQALGASGICSVQSCSPLNLETLLPGRTCRKLQQIILQNSTKKGPRFSLYIWHNKGRVQEACPGGVSRFKRHYSGNLQGVCPNPVGAHKGPVQVQLSNCQYWAENQTRFTVCKTLALSPVLSLDLVLQIWSMYLIPA